MFKMDLEKAEEPEIKLSTPVGSSEKQESSRETFTSALFSTPKPLTLRITANSGKYHGWRSLVGYSPWGLKELDTTE